MNQFMVQLGVGNDGLVAELINTSIPQTFVNKVINNKLGKDDKDKRVNLKCHPKDDFYMQNKTRGICKLLLSV